MIRVLSAVCAAALVCGCATQASTEPGTGSGAAYAPMVDMEGVEANAYAQDVEACREAALKVRVQRTKHGNSDVADVLVIGVAMVFPVAMVGVAAIAGIASAVSDEINPNGWPADPQMQQTALVNCMARKGYKNIDPNVTVTYLVAPKTKSQLPPRKTGVDTYVAEKFAKANSCSATPRAVLEAKGPGFEQYSIACANGRSIALRCEFGNCTQNLVAGN